MAKKVNQVSIVKILKSVIVISVVNKTSAVKLVFAISWYNDQIIAVAYFIKDVFGNLLFHQ